MAFICFASPSGGVGRTTLAANVARALARGDSRVIAIDLDPQNALGLHFGLDLRDAFGFLSTLHYAADPLAAWRAALRSSLSGVSFLPYGQVGLDGANAVNAALFARPDILATAIADMLSIPGLTLVADLPAGPSPALSAVLCLADLLIVPLLPTPASAAQVPAIEGGRFAGAGLAGGFDATRVRFVVNQWAAAGSMTGLIAESLVQQLGERMIGAVRYHDAVAEAAAAQNLLADVSPLSDAALDIDDLAAAVALFISRVRKHPKSEVETGINSKMSRSLYG